jgi:hypothetical protein
MMDQSWPLGIGITPQTRSILITELDIQEIGGMFVPDARQV